MSNGDYSVRRPSFDKLRTNGLGGGATVGLFYVYILRCADGSYYTGHTDDLEARLDAFQQGAYSGYTASRRPFELVWRDEFESRYDAVVRERQIKGWSRGKKEALIRGDWDALPPLSRSHKDKRLTAQHRSS